MLDSEAEDLTPEPQDTLAAEGDDTIAAEEAGEVIIGIEGEDPEPDEDSEVEAELGDRGKRALKAARDAAKESARKLREAEARAAALEAAVKPKEADELGPRPVIADYGFNDDLHAAALIEWHEKKRKADDRKAEEQNAVKAATEAYNAKLTRYHAERTKVGVDDEAQAVVVGALTPQQQSALMDASLDPAKVVAALSKTPKVLAELAGIKEIHKFTYRLAQIEGKITMTTKAPPPPETKLRGGVAAPAGNLSAQLAAAEKRADQTGDRTEVQRIKRQMRDAGVAA